MMSGRLFLIISRYICTSKLIIMAKTFKTFTMLALFSVASVILFAASGGKEKKGSKSKALTVSNATVGKISLRSAYQFKGNKLISLNTKKDYVSLNHYTSLQKGNKTVIITSKQIVPKPVLSTKSNTNIDVKILKLRLN